MTEFTFNLMLLGAPGIICYFFSQRLIGKSQHTSLTMILLVFLYSFLSYLLVGSIEAFVNLCLGGGFKSEILEFFLKGEQEIRIEILGYTAFSGVILAYLLSYSTRYKIANKVGQKIKATNRYGDEDVWEYFHDLPDREKNQGWVIVRDLKTELAYYCTIRVWSDSRADRELILSDVGVYTNDTSRHLYDSKLLYLSREKDDISIEVPPDQAAEMPQYQLKDDEENE